MDKVRFYKVLDIESPEEFQYYENLSSLLEEDEFIEENLIKDLFKDIDTERLPEQFESYFENFLSHIPESENEMYIVVESIKRAFDGLIYEEMSEDDISSLAHEVSKFRKWYIHDLNAYDRLHGNDTCVRDARYDIAAAKLLGEDFDFDFRRALDYDLEGFNVRLADMVAASFTDDQTE